MFLDPTSVVIVLDLAAIVWIVVAITVINRRIRRSRVEHWRCGRCSYDLTGHVSDRGEVAGRCPECGAEFSDTRPVAPGKTDRRQAIQYWRTALAVFWVIWLARIGYEVLSFFAVAEFYWTDGVELGLELLVVAGMLFVWWRINGRSSHG